MAQVIARIYSNGEQAAAAANEARALGYGDREVFVCNPSSGATKADCAASLTQAGMGRDEADACADEMTKGRSVVLVHAIFGGGAKATAALEKHNPIGAAPTKFTSPAKSSATRRTASSAGASDDAAPLSNLLGWPTLIDSPTPFSDYFKLSVLAPFTSKVQVSNTTTTKVHVTNETTTKVELIDDPAPFSRKMGWKTLIDDPAPLSRALNWGLLIDDPAPLSRKAGLPVLND